VLCCAVLCSAGCDAPGVYVGHYVPNLALAIYDSNQEGVRPFIDIQGFLVGNAWTVAPVGTPLPVDPHLACTHSPVRTDNQGAAFYWSGRHACVVW
jgi:hypothetical protein